MKLQRLLPEANLPRTSGTDTVNFQQFDQVGNAVRRFGNQITESAGDIDVVQRREAALEKALRDKEAASVAELDVQSGLSSFKTRASQIIAKNEQIHRMNIAEGGKVPHAYFEDTLNEIDEAMFEIEGDDTLPLQTRRALKVEMLKHRDLTVPELQKSQTGLNVERNEGHLAEVEAQLTKQSQLETDVRAGVFVSRYETELRRSAAAGFISRQKAEERIQKVSTKIYSDRFERLIATDPEAAFRTVSSDSYHDRDMLNHVEPKILETFLKAHKEGAKKADKDQIESLQDKLAATVDPLVRNGGISRKDVEALRPDVKREVWQSWMTQLDTNDKRIVDAIEKRRKGEEANLKVERDEVRKQFYDLYFDGKDIPHELQDIMRTKLDATEWRETSKMMSDRRDVGGAGNQELLLRRKEEIKKNVNAYSARDIAKMTDLNVKQRLELYKEREGEIAFHRSAEQDPTHFTKDPAYKFYGSKIEELLGVIKLSPLTSGKDVQVVADAEIEFRQTFERAYKKGQRVTEQQAEKLAENIVGRYRKLLTFAAEAVKKPARYKSPEQLQQAWIKGEINGRDEYVEEWEKMKLAQQEEQRKSSADAEKTKKFERKK